MPYMYHSKTRERSARYKGHRMLAGIACPEGISTLGFVQMVAAGQAAGMAGKVLGLKGTAGKAASTAGSAAAGAQAGSMIVPGIGTAVGAVIGAAMSLLGGKKIAHAEATWDNFKKIAGQGAFANSDDDYVVAEIWKGAFDTNNKTFKGGPIQNRGQYVTWMAQQLNKGLAEGKINEQSTPFSVVDEIIIPGMRAYGAGLKNNFRNLYAEMVVRLLNGKSIGNEVKGKTASDFVSLQSAGFPAGFTPPSANSTAPSPSVNPQAPVTPVFTAAPAPQAVKVPSDPLLAPQMVSLPSGGFVGPTSGSDPVANLKPYIDALMSQGATQQQAFTSALNALSSQGIQPTAAVQQAVATEVKSASGIKPEYLIVGGIAGLGLLVFLMTRKKGR